MLTSHDDDQLTEIGLAGPCDLAVLRLAALARDAGANPEQVRHGEDGWLVSSDDPAEWSEAIGALAGDESLRQRLAVAARRRFDEEYDFGRYLDRYEEACHAAVLGGAR